MGLKSLVLALLLTLASHSGGASEDQLSTARPDGVIGTLSRIDLGTALGVLGVVLTIIFFIVGYRQTIGAKKERARAASREIVDTLLRRLVLEPDFLLNVEGIVKMIAGKALEHKVLPRDMFYPSDIEAILFSKIVESDYIPTAQRKPILERLEKCFKEPASAPHFEPAMERSGTLKTSALLGLASALSAFALVSFSAFLVGKKRGLEEFPTEAFPSVLQLAAAVGGVILITAILLVIVVRLRDRTQTSELPVNTPASLGQSFEAHIARRLKSLGLSVQRPMDGPDFIVATDQGRYGIEAILNITRMGQSRIAKMVKSLGHVQDRHQLKKIFIVSAAPVPDNLKTFSTDDVTIISELELVAMLSQHGKAA